MGEINGGSLSGVEAMFRLMCMKKHNPPIHLKEATVSARRGWGRRGVCRVVGELMMQHNETSADI